MVDYLKSWMGYQKKEGEKEIPEIHLQKNEKKFYYDEKLKKYVFEGENPEEDAKPTLPPPKIKSDKTKTKKPLIGTSRYVSAFGANNIISNPITPETPNDNEKEIAKTSQNPGGYDSQNYQNIEEKTKEEENKEKEENKENVNDIEDKNDIKGNNQIKEEKENEKKEEKEDQDEYQIGMNFEANNFNNNNIKSLNSLKKMDGRSEISEIPLREDYVSMYQNDLNDVKKNIIEEEIIKIKEEYNQTLKQKELEFETQINELKEMNQFSEETYNETTSVLKNQINNFIKENLELKSNTEKLMDEIEYHKKEVNEYKNLFEHYKKLVEENNNSKIMSTPGEEEVKSSETNQHLMSSIIVDK
jgi:hypothetical protein